MDSLKNPNTTIHFQHAAVPAALGLGCAVMGMAINTRSFFQGMRLFAIPAAMPVAAGIGQWMASTIYVKQEHKATDLSPLAKAALVGGVAWALVNIPLYGLSQLYTEKLAPFVAGLNGALAGSLVLGSATAATLLSLPEKLEERE